MHPEERLRAEVVRASHALHARGWVANHDGNISVRLEEGRFLATPTATSKGAVSPESLIVVDGQGQLLAGTRKPFSELKLHFAAYSARGDVAAVVHAHPPTATGFAVAGVELGEPFMAEPVVSLGPRLPLVGLSEDPGSALMDADVLMLANHGVLAVGPDIETCLLRIELVEHLCRIALVARQLGGPRPLPAEQVEKLAEQHRKLFPRTAGGLAPAASASGAELPPLGDAGRLVAEALRRFS